MAPCDQVDRSARPIAAKRWLSPDPTPGCEPISMPSPPNDSFRARNPAMLPCLAAISRPSLSACGLRASEFCTSDAGHSRMRAVQGILANTVKCRSRSLLKSCPGVFNSALLAWNAAHASRPTSRNSKWCPPSAWAYAPQTSHRIVRGRTPCLCLSSAAVLSQSEVYHGHRVNMAQMKERTPAARSMPS